MRLHLSPLLMVLALTGCSTHASNDQAGTDEAAPAPTGTSLLTEVRSRVVPQGANLGPMQQCNLDEERFQTVERAVLHPLRDAWKAQDAAKIAALGTPGLEVSGVPAALGAPSATGAGIEQTTWAVAPGKADLAGYLAQFSSLESVQLDTWQVRAGERQKDGGYKDAELTVGFDARGLDKSGWRRNDRGTMQVKAVNKDGKGWKLARVAITQGDTVRAEKAAFTEVTASSGLDKVTTYQRVEAMRRGGYAIAMGDYDKDGNQDMYVGTWGPGTLLRGDGKGGWSPVANAGLKGESLVKTSIFADMDNDGWQDLLLVRFTPDGSEDLVYYKNDKGTFADAGRVFTGRVPAGHAMPAAVADFNKDGFLDFYVGYPGAKDFTVIEGVTQDRAVQGMLLNDGKGGFSDVTKATFTGAQPSTLFAHSVMAVDYDTDGDSDLVVIDDRGGLSPVYQNQGDGTFTQVAKDIGVGNEGFGMGIAAGDIDADGDEDFVMTNVDFVAGHRVADSCKLNWNTTLAAQPTRGLRAFENKGNGTFTEITETAGLSWAGEGLAGAEFIDYDNDGALDLYVAAGLWSGTTPDQDLSSLFVRAYADRVKWGESAALLSYQPENDVELKDWYQQQTEAPAAHRMESQSSFMKVLQTYQGDLQNPGTGAGERPSMAGFEHNRLFRNDGSGRFVEVGYVTGVDSLADGYVIARTDYDHDGRMDLVLRNGDPGTSENLFAPVQVFHNDTPNTNSLMVSLEGSDSNRDGVGAHVSITVGESVLTQQLIGNNGTAQSEKVLHFGLAANTQVDRVVVRWPSGRTQELTGVAAGRLLIREADAKDTARAGR
jgi:hypothetical protein